MTYDTIPIKTLCILLDDENRIAEFGIGGEEWAKIKEEYTSKNPSREVDELMSEYSIMIKNEIEELKGMALIEFLSGFHGDAEPFFLVSGIKYTGDKEKDIQRLIDHIGKSGQKKKIHKSRCEQLAGNILEKRKNDPPEPLNIAMVNESLASMEMAGANIPNYEKFTAGQYDAWNAILKKKNNKNGR